MKIKGHELEYFDDGHIYLVDGIIVPSITEILKVRFGRKYEGISKDTLKRAADRGTAIHEAIELFCSGVYTDLPEVKNFTFLERQYGFAPIANEVPVILFDEDEPIAGGRLDMVIVEKEEHGLADIKTTSTLDKEYLAYQLNLYRIAYQQSYGADIKLLRGLHLRGDVRKYVPIPINEAAAWELVREYKEKSL